MTIGDSKLSNINNGINLKYPVSVRLQGLLLFRWSGQDRMSRTHTHTHAGEMNFAACCSVSDLSPCSGQSPAAGSNTSRADITTQICFTKTLQGKSK